MACRRDHAEVVEHAARLGLIAAVAALLAVAPAAGDEAPQPAAPTAVVLLTLDTTRADALGCYGGHLARTPALDGLAARGVRYAEAVSPAPLTLPAHTSLLTGLEPPEHGVRANGGAALGRDVPTLAIRLEARGWATGAFVASRVLDRRFGLDRGFAVYDDRIAAERVGEYGYAERNAEEVTTAAIAWLGQLPTGRPYLLWVHYYDPHLPYSPPADLRGSSPRADYAGEVTFMDREIGRLLASLPGDPARRLVAAVGDHGEALGEHGEQGHGVLLYRGVLEVPLLLAGPGLPAGRVVAEPVATRRLAATLLALLGDPGAGEVGPPLPGIPGLDSGPARPIYSETRLPLTAYGWSPLEAVTSGHWRYIRAPRPELYNLTADPAEARNLADSEPAERQRLATALGELEASMVSRSAAPVQLDAETAGALEALGYAAGAASPVSDGIDPKDGLALLGDFDKAKGAIAAGRFAEAVEALDRLVARNPHNVPFLAQQGVARMGGGDPAGAVASYRQAVALSPDSELLRLGLARALGHLGKVDEARAEYGSALRLDPRLVTAWIDLAELDRTASGAAAERATLEKALAAGTVSATLLVRLARLEAAAGEKDSAERHLEQATTLVPEWPLPWLEWGSMAEKQGKLPLAEERYHHAEQLDPSSPDPPLALGKLCLGRGDRLRARALLRRAATLGRDTDAGREAEALLQKTE